MSATQPTLTLLVDQAAQVAATIVDGYGNPIPYSSLTSPVQWTTTDATVATAFGMANNNGVIGIVTGVKIGTATITATAGSATTTLSVSVVAPNPQVPTSIILDINKTNP